MKNSQTDKAPASERGFAREKQINHGSRRVAGSSSQATLQVLVDLMKKKEAYELACLEEE